MQDSVIGKKQLDIKRTVEMGRWSSLSIQMNSDQHLCRKKLPKAGERKHLKELKLIVLGIYTDLGIVPIPTG